MEKQEMNDTVEEIKRKLQKLEDKLEFRANHHSYNLAGIEMQKGIVGVVTVEKWLAFLNSNYRIIQSSLELEIRQQQERLEACEKKKMGLEVRESSS
jgi:hypothetical protein